MDTNEKDEKGKEENEEKKFYVIGAGLPRTGTQSLMYALEILLPGKCYHGFKTHQHEAEWCDIMGGKYTDDEYKKFLISNDYVAGVDSPVCYAYERMQKIFPDAKVVLTLREPEAWVKSMNSIVLDSLSLWNAPATLFGRFFPTYLTMWSSDATLRGWSKRLIDALVVDKIVYNILVELDQGRGVEAFRRWVHDVESNVPEEKLLKFHVKDGWEPLCRHLNLPVPTVPFPYVNKTENISFYIQRNKRRGWLLLYELVSIPLLAYGVYILSRR